MQAHSWKKTYWAGTDGIKTSIRIIDFLLKDEPVVSLKIKDLAHILSLAEDQHRIQSADLSVPIIVVEKDKKFLYILDGHHRRQKAIGEKRTHILAKIFKGEVINESTCSLQNFER